MRYNTNKYTAGYLIAARGSDKILRGTSVVFSDIEEAKAYVDRMNTLHPNIELTIRCQ
tara:strand:+ start:45640 stop:45813 length:174 start_codon:yes stop_codon:yes gene_type:complete